MLFNSKRVLRDKVLLYEIGRAVNHSGVTETHLRPADA